MIVFIDLRNQLYSKKTPENKEGEPCFAFYCTIRDEFITFCFSQIWESWDDFEMDFSGDNIERYKKICPDWVF